MTAPLRLQLFGGFQLLDADGNPIHLTLRKTEALLAFIASLPGQTTSRDRLSSLLWGDFERTRARQSLRQALLALTKGLVQQDTTVLRLESQSVSLTPGAITVDVRQFEDLLAQGDMEALEDAVGLYAGEFLAGISIGASEFNDWLTEERNRYQELALQAALDVIHHQETQGRIAAAIETAKQASRIDPLREDIHRDLMRLYDKRGMRSSAITQFRLCRDTLLRELGIQPDDATMALYQSIVEQGQWPNGDQAGAAAPRPASGFEEGSFDTTDQRLDQSIFVGRRAELRKLQRLLRHTREGGARAAAVIGETGIGKSHLIQSLIGTAESEGFDVLTLSIGLSEQDAALGLWADLAERILAREGSDLPERLPPWARRELGRLSPAYGGGKADASAAGVSQRIDEALLALFREVSTPQGLLVVFEDLEGADDASLRLLPQLLPKLAVLPILLVATIRTGDASAESLATRIIGELEADGVLELLSLGALSRAESDELVERLQEALDPEGDTEPRREQIWRLSEGNPQLIIETMLASTAPQAEGGPESLAIPAQVLSESARLLGQLSDAAQSLLRAASVIGPFVEEAVLQKVVGLADRVMAEAAEELVAGQILAPRREGYRFVRDRVRLAVYEGLIPPRRKILHAAVAEAIGQVHEDELEPHYQALAHHCHEAGDHVAALRYELGSALVEMSRGLPGSAREWLARTLRTCARLGGGAATRGIEADAHIALASLHEMSEDFDSAAISLKAAEHLIKTLHDQSRLALAQSAWSRLHYVSGDEKAAYSYGRSGLVAAERSGYEGLWRPADRLITRIHLMEGPATRIAERLARGKQRSHDLGLRLEEADAAAMIALLHGVQGDFERANAESEEAVALAETTANELYLAACLQFRGMVRAWYGDVDGALEAYANAGAIAHGRGDLYRLYVLHGHRGVAQLAAERFEEAAAELERAIEMAERLRTRFLLPFFTAWRAEAALGANGDDEGLELCRTAFRLSAETNQPWARSLAFRALARALLRPNLRDLYRAERAIRSAMDIQRGLGLSVELAHSCLIHARILRARGETGRSSETFLEASEMFGHMGMVAECARAGTLADALKPHLEEGP